VNTAFLRSVLFCCLLVIVNTCCTLRPEEEEDRSTYYVSLDGSDGNSGGPNTPFRTLQAAVDHAGPGDVITVRDGVYRSTGSRTCGDECGAEQGLAIIRKAGTADAWITIRAEHRWKAVLDSHLISDAAFILAKDANYISIEDFDITGGYWAGVHSNENSHHIRIRGNHFEHIGNRMYNPKGVGWGIVGAFAGYATHDFEFDGNLFNNIGRLPGDARIAYNHDQGLYLCGNNITVVNNVFYDNTAGWGIQIAPKASNYTIANNTFAGANPERDGQIVLWGSHANIEIRNNIFFNPRNFAIDTFQDSESGSRVDHNLVFGNHVDLIAKPDAGLTVADNRIGSDPRFVNPGDHDYRLQPGSPAIGAGISVPSVTRDFDGQVRPEHSPYDVGAFVHADHLTRP